jgi:hypothetical protein
MYNYEKLTWNVENPQSIFFSVHCCLYIDVDLGGKGLESEPSLQAMAVISSWSRAFTLGECCNSRDTMVGVVTPHVPQQWRRRCQPRYCKFVSKRERDKILL